MATDITNIAHIPQEKQTEAMANRVLNEAPDLYKYFSDEFKSLKAEEAVVADIKNIEHIPQEKQTQVMASRVLNEAPELYFSLAEKYQSLERLEIAVNKHPNLLGELVLIDTLQERYPEFNSSTRDNVEVSKVAVVLDPSLYLETSPRLQKDPEFLNYSLEAARDALNMGRR